MVEKISKENVEKKDTDGYDSGLHEVGTPIGIWWVWDDTSKDSIGQAKVFLLCHPQINFDVRRLRWLGKISRPSFDGKCQNFCS